MAKRIMAKRNLKRNLLDSLGDMKRAENYSKTLIEIGYDRYCGHHKIIRYTADGFPVYTASQPPLYSPAYANSQVNLMFRSIQNRLLPSLSSIALTDVCNARCEHCSFFNSINDPSKNPLSLDELKDFIRQSQDLGVSTINILGGEPLMHPEWREVVATIDKRRSYVFMFTNGWFLAESAADLAAAGAGGVYVSIDASDAETHDHKRGTEGLFDKALEGIAAAKKVDLTVGISCCIDQEGFEGGELDRIIELGRRQGVHEVLIFDAMPVGRFCNRDDLWGSQTWIDQMIEHVRTYNEDENYPGVLVYAYMSSYMSMGCPGGTSYLYVSPYGEICPCDFHHHKFGNIREEKLNVIWDRMNQELAPHGSNWNGCWAKHKE
ncbi:MAG: radical SAM protein [Clostridiales bacterium]|jgi:MoaA/NifB/PqqE/SkfB family radical SAM enzyme|nr:radical SAM protein [Clostridiales bacterium]